MHTVIRRRLGLASLAMVAVLAVLTVLPTQAIAIPQDNPSYPTACAGVWHWVHNQTAATKGTLTAIFMIDGVEETLVADSALRSDSTNLHYYIELTTEATLMAAFDNVDDGKLLLSNWPTCPGDTAPEVTVPEVTVPEVTVPEVTVPEVTVPDVTPPEEVAPTGEVSADVTDDTTRLEVFGTTITTAAVVAEATSETLPFTGIGLETTGGIAFSLVAMGGLILLSFGYRPGTERSYEGRHRRPARPGFRPSK